MYSNNKTGIIFVVNSADRDRILVARDHFYSFLMKVGGPRLLRDAIVLVLATHQDIPSSMTTLEIQSRLALPRTSSICVQAVCVPTGEGLCEGLYWLSRQHLLASPPTIVVPCPKRDRAAMSIVLGTQRRAPGRQSLALSQQKHRILELLKPLHPMEYRCGLWQWQYEQGECQVHFCRNGAFVCDSRDIRGQWLDVGDGSLQIDFGQYGKFQMWWKSPKELCGSPLENYYVFDNPDCSWRTATFIRRHTEIENDVTFANVRPSGALEQDSIDFIFKSCGDAVVLQDGMVVYAPTKDRCVRR
jgi:hypothetical protein